MRARRRPYPVDPSGRRPAADRAAGRRIPPASPGLPGLWGDHLRTLPEGVPSGHFGPYTQAVLATLAGAYRLSKRQIQQLAGDLFGLSISTGMISKLERQSAQALKPPTTSWPPPCTPRRSIHADETSWREDRGKAWLWVAVTALSTVFTIARNRNAKVAQAVLGTQEGPIAVTDRFSSYDWIAGASRQVCWSHLRRDFQAMIDRGGAAEPIGRKLLRLSDRLSRWWHRLGADEVDWGRFGAAMARLGARSSRPWRTGCAATAPRRAGRAPRCCGWRRACGPSPECAGTAGEQRGGARRAACGDLAAGQRGDR